MVANVLCRRYVSFDIVINLYIWWVNWMKKEEINIWWAGLKFIFCKNKYYELALQHDMKLDPPVSGINETDEEKKAKYNRKCAAYSEQLTKSIEKIRNGFWGSFKILIYITVIVMLFCFFSGSINYNLSVDFNKVLSFFGTFLASWGTLMALGEGIQTYGGQTFPEKTHPVLFKILFIPGVVLMLLGIAI
ncbi:membrane protein [Aliivibrio wodanis]|uniref:Membrane protein n=1 Tax=Aliivibrio wodanis TaxID=80852 RepID=A0A090I6R1_9GAMM|nr:membrane protein [Aliivibrio wodanis]